jgi:cytochrome c peroxidase
MKTGIRLMLMGTIVLAACGEDSIDPAGTGQNQAPSTFNAQQANSLRMGVVGQKVFFDQNLSINRNQSCASCHDPAFGFTSPNPVINQHGSVMEGSIPGRFAIRKPPSAAYAMAPALFFDGEAWVGGNFWDGRAKGDLLGNPLADQALNPFVGAAEQALPDLACVVHRVSISSYVSQYKQVFGGQIATINFPANTDALCSAEGNTVPLDPTDRAKAITEYQNVARSIAAFETSHKVSPFNSRFDNWTHGRGNLTPVELRGFMLFNGKAQCSACHPSDGDRAMFTDFTYDNIGVPANLENPALISTGFVDRGLGVTLGDAGLDGAQKVPTLRNLDRRPDRGVIKSYMHNGVFKNLQQVVHFYNTRDVLPTCSSPTLPTDPAFGVTCWPAPEVAENVNHDELGDLHLTAEEEAAVVAYLRTLSDQ